MVYLQEDLAEGHVLAPEEGEWVGLRPRADLQGAAEPVAIYRALVKAIYSGVALFKFFLKLFFSFSFLALKICLPIDGVARIFILFFLFFLYTLETLDHTNLCVWFHFLPTTLDRRARKKSEYCNSTQLF